jgi:VanZ family protein
VRRVAAGPQHAFRLLLAAALALTTWQALTPAPVADPHGYDKLLHAAAFFAFAFLADRGWPDERYWLPKALPLLAYGALIELAQSTTASRSAEWLDLAADGAGLLLYALAAALLRPRAALAGRRQGSGR